MKIFRFDRRSLLSKPFEQRTRKQLTEKIEHRIELKIPDQSSGSNRIHFYEIFTDDNNQCTLICESGCVQSTPMSSDYFLSSRNCFLLLFCVDCRMIDIYLSLDWTFFVSFPLVTRDFLRLEFTMNGDFQEISFPCIKNLSTRIELKRKFHRVRHQNESCRVDSNEIQPFHEAIFLECDSFLSSTSLIVWAIVRSDIEEKRVWLSPIPPLSKLEDDRIRFRIDGIPNGNLVELEIRSPNFSFVESYPLKVNSIPHQNPFNSVQFLVFFTISVTVQVDL